MPKYRAPQDTPAQYQNKQKAKQLQGSHCGRRNLTGSTVTASLWLCDHNNFYSLEYSLEYLMDIERTDAEAEMPILWPLWCKELTHGKRPWCWESWRQEEKGMTEDEMVGCYHQLNGHKSEQALGVGDGQGSLACCSPWGCKESGMTEQLNWISYTVRGSESM